MKCRRRALSVSPTPSPMKHSTATRRALSVSPTPSPMKRSTAARHALSPTPSPLKCTTIQHATPKPTFPNYSPMDDDQDFDVQLATSQKHLQRRLLADKHYRFNAQRMKDRYNNSKRVHTFEEGDTVSLRIPRIDRSATDLHRLPCIVVQRIGRKRFLYRLQCVLNTCYPAGELEAHSGSVMTTDLKSAATISLWEAAKKSNPMNAYYGTFCSCKGDCSGKKCSCKLACKPCSTRCHSGRLCLNHRDQTCPQSPHCDSQADLQSSSQQLQTKISSQQRQTKMSPSQERQTKTSSSQQCQTTKTDLRSSLQQRQTKTSPPQERQTKTSSSQQRQTTKILLQQRQTKTSPSQERQTKTSSSQQRQTMKTDLRSSSQQKTDLRSSSQQHQTKTSPSQQRQMKIHSQSAVDIDKLPTPPPTDWWVSEFSLRAQDRSALYKGEWLNDLHISAAQQLLKANFPEIGSFQSSLLGVPLKFQSVKANSIQILNFSGHWACVSTMRCDPGHVNVYDSLFIEPSTSLVQQLCCLLRPKHSHLTLNMMEMQKQDGTSDCGCFAIACATALCYDQDPSAVTWEQNKMRQHLGSCISTQRLTPFPKKKTTSKKTTGATNKTFTFPVFCSCRMPANRKGMLRCIKCMEWFHRNCCNIPHSAFRKKTIPWTCPGCAQ